MKEECVDIMNLLKSIDEIIRLERGHLINLALTQKDFDVDFLK